MAVKSIIDVEIDPNGAFKAFYEQFQQYQEKLEAMPDDWKKINDSISDSHKEFADAFGALSDSQMSSARETRALVEHLRNAADAQKSFRVETGKSKDELDSMGKAAKDLAKDLFGIGSFLFKIGALGVGAALGTGIAGIYGMDKLAGNVVGNQRAARGLGMTTGQYKAFGTDFGRYLDPSITGSIADAQNSFSGRMYLGMAAGMNQNDLASMDPGAVAARLALRAHDWWQNTPANMRTSEALQATGFMQSGLTLSDMRRLGLSERSGLERAGSQYASDQGALDTSDKSTDAWYELERQIKLAGQTIETDLTNQLVDLAPSLRDFISTITKDANILIKDVLTPQNMKALADGIGDVTTYLGSEQFKQDLKDFGTAIGNIVGFLRSAGILHAAADVQQTPGMVDKMAGKVQSMGGIPAYFSNMEKAGKLPAGLLYAQEMVESGGNIGAISPKGAKGPFQFMDSASQQYGLADPFNLHDSADAASRYDSDLSKRYGGDIRKTLAAYNWGPGNVDKDISQNGKDWESHLPAATEAYINKIVSLMAKNGQTVRIDIHNSTTAKVATSMNASPH